MLGIWLRALLFLGEVVEVEAEAGVGRKSRRYSRERTVLLLAAVEVEVAEELVIVEVEERVDLAI